MAAFLEEFDLSRHPRILDVGGASDTWPAEVAAKAAIVLLNMPRAAGETFAPGFLCVAADARRLPFGDGSFDIVFSNSVIEHVGSRDDQARFAAEIARVGKGFWVQTPNRYFPIEQHLLTPFIHWLPRRWAGWIAPRFTFWALLRRPTGPEKRWYIEHFLNDIRLCSRRDLRAMFPGALIRTERFLLFAKSLIAIRK